MCWLWGGALTLGRTCHRAGAKYLTDEEALEVGKDNMRHSHATHDLYNAIDRGDFPEWEYAAQVRPQLYLPNISEPWRCPLHYSSKLWRCTYPVLTPQLPSCSALRMSCSPPCMRVHSSGCACRPMRLLVLGLAGQAAMHGLCLDVMADWQIWRERNA